MEKIAAGVIAFAACIAFWVFVDGVDWWKGALAFLCAIVAERYVNKMLSR